MNIVKFPSRVLCKVPPIAVLVIIGLFAFYPVLSYADEIPIQQSDSDPPLLEDLKQQIVQLQEKLAAMEQKERNLSVQNIQPHKPNYALPLTWTSPSINRMNQEIQFQFSLHQQVTEYKNFQFFWAYSQKSFFQFYDSENSRPFRESNYNPELFVRTPAYLVPEWGIWQFDAGYEHESNGREIPFSRSWDRVILRLRIEQDSIIYHYKTWYRIPEKEKRREDDPKGDDNPDIWKFYGHNQLEVRWNWQHLTMAIMGRYAFKTNKGGLEINISFPAFGKMRGLLQYWDGYGESLIDYNRHLNKFGIGILFTQ